MDIKKIRTTETHFDTPIACALYDNGLPEVDSAGTPVVLQVVSEYSTPARRVGQIQKQQVAALLRQYGAYENIPQAELDAMSDARTAACIVDWTGIEADGQAVPYSSENALEIVAALRQYKPTHLKQIEGKIAAHAAFFTKPSAA